MIKNALFVTLLIGFIPLFESMALGADDIMTLSVNDDHIPTKVIEVTAEYQSSGKFFCGHFDKWAYVPNKEFHSFPLGKGSVKIPKVNRSLGCNTYLSALRLEAPNPYKYIATYASVEIAHRYTRKYFEMEFEEPLLSELMDRDYFEFSCSHELSDYGCDFLRGDKGKDPDDVASFMAFTSIDQDEVRIVLKNTKNK